MIPDGKQCYSCMKVHYDADILCDECYNRQQDDEDAYEAFQQQMAEAEHDEWLADNEPENPFWRDDHTH